MLLLLLLSLSADPRNVSRTVLNVIRVSTYCIINYNIGYSLWTIRQSPSPSSTVGCCTALVFSACDRDTCDAIPVTRHALKIISIFYTSGVWISLKYYNWVCGYFLYIYKTIEIIFF